MVDLELTVSNYRCFGDEPARISIKDGFAALVGTNNSGKSSLLRMLYELRPVIAATADFMKGTLPSPRLTTRPNVAEGERVFHVGNDRPILLKIGGDTVFDPLIRIGLSEGSDVQVNYDRTGALEVAIGGYFSLNRAADGEDLRHLLRQAFDRDHLDLAFQALTRTQYIGPFRGVSQATEHDYFDLLTAGRFGEKFVEFKAGLDPVKNDMIVEALEELRRIFGYRSLDINVSPHGGLQIAVDGRSYRISEHGSGLSHFVMVVMNAIFKQPSFILIDEPELNLHASLQLDFLSLLGKYARNGVIFATHSLGLARTAADRIYTLTKTPGGTSRVREYDSEPELVTMLGQLSFDKTPELGFDRVLLVEGKTELRAIAQMLRLYGKEHQIMLLPLHGDEMIRGDVERELSDLKRLTPNLQYLIDSEREDKDAALSRNRQAFVDLCGSLDIPGHVLERRALENYLPEHALTKAFGSRVRTLAPYEKKGKENDWPKAGHWKAAGYMSLADLSDTDLGRFLDGA
ncbi:ATP-dependent nuclease [Actinoplanes sp. CA-142083]|uniref:ATP-dependent nuclease n=1 Tax=Actinoplanes sp. CA-142083 TaxID=3239903 RepID=UPI003D8A681C